MNEPTQVIANNKPSIKTGELVSADKILSVIINNALDGRASDIHIEPTAEEIRVRYRVDGVLHSSLTLPLELHAALLRQLRDFFGLPEPAALTPQSGSCKFEYNQKRYNILAYFLPLVQGEKVTLRLIPAYDQPPTLSELGFADYHLSLIEANLAKPGLFLVTGPMHAGKTTTLYTLLNILNQDEVNITTLEDPIERYLPGLNQMNVKMLDEVSAVTALNIALKQNPDILMIDNLHGQEIEQLANLALTSEKKIFSTLPSENFLAALRRLLSLGLSPLLLSEAVNLIISQRLARRICDHCRTEVKASPLLLAAAQKAYQDAPANFPKFEDLIFYSGAGCEHCGHSGFSGQLVLAEVGTLNSRASQFLNSADLKTWPPQTLDEQFISLPVDAIMKANQGLISLEEASKVF